MYHHDHGVVLKALTFYAVDAGFSSHLHASLKNFLLFTWISFELGKIKGDEGAIMATTLENWPRNHSALAKDLYTTFKDL